MFIFAWPGALEHLPDLNYSIMKSTIYTAAMAIFLMIAATSKAQTTPADQASASRWYIQLPGLNTTNYAELHTALEAHPRYTIRVACVPAGVLVIGLRNGKQPGAQEWLELRALLQTKGFSQPGQIENATDETFMQLCRNARMGQ